MSQTETAAAVDRVEPTSAAVRPSYRKAGAVAGAAVLGAAALAIALSSGGNRADTPQRASVEARAAALSEQAARQLNEEGLVRIDAKTTRLGVTAEGSRLVYRMGLSEDIPAARIEATRASLAEANAQALCTGPDTSRLIGLGGSFEHVYIDASGDTFSTLVTRCGAAVSAPPLPRAM